MANQQNSHNWAGEVEEIHLVVTRSHDRRQAAQPGPWITDEGFVLVERRSGQDRRFPDQQHEQVADYGLFADEFSCAA